MTLAIHAEVQARGARCLTPGGGGRATVCRDAVFESRWWRGGVGTENVALSTQAAVSGLRKRSGLDIVGAAIMVRVGMTTAYLGLLACLTKQNLRPHVRGSLLPRQQQLSDPMVTKAGYRKGITVDLWLGVKSTVGCCLEIYIVT